ncbi:MAG: TetR/AcrR family transcriptional regulator [Terriglobales bacterium]
MTVQGKTRRQALTEFREAEILEAARKVFGEHGFADSTVDLIAAEAGVAKGTVYLYYDSKEELMWEALRSRMREMLEQTKSAMEAVEDTRAKIQAALRVRFEFFRSDEQFLRMYLAEFGHLCRINKPHPVQAVYQEAAQYLAGVLADGVRLGELRRLDPVETALALMEMVKDVFSMRFTRVPGQNPEFDGERFVFELFWNGVAARKEGVENPA